jgi:hypothetical protein
MSKVENAQTVSSLVVSPQAMLAWDGVPPEDKLELQQVLAGPERHRVPLRTMEVARRTFVLQRLASGFVIVYEPAEANTVVSVLTPHELLRLQH